MRSKLTGEVIGVVPSARWADVDAAIAAAQQAAPVMAAMPAHRRSEILARASALIRERRQGRAALVVESEHHHLEALADRVYAIERGEVVPDADSTG